MRSISRRTSALAGLVLGPLWLGVVAVMTWLEWDYLHSLGWDFVHHREVNYPSTTATGDWGVLQIVNFAAAGVLAGVFLVGFRREFRHRWAGRVATGGLGVFALAGLFNAFTTDLPGEPITWHGWLHGFGFLGTMLGMLIGFTASGLALRDNPDWRGWQLMGAVPVLLVVTAFTGLGLPGDTSWYVFLVLGFGWFSVMGLRLHQIAARDEPAPTRAGVTAASPGML